MTNKGRGETDGMEAGDDPALWSLLGRQTPPGKVSPYFGRRVLRDVTMDKERQTGRWWERLTRFLPNGRFARHAALGSGALSGVCAALLLVATHAGKPPVKTEMAVPREATPMPAARDAAAATPVAVARTEAEARPVVSPQDVEVIADLDNVLEREESHLWTDEDTARF